MKFYLYILRSKVDNSFYIGQTNNLEDRVERHNSGRAGYTKSKMPWELVHSEEFKDRTSCLKREKEIKSWKSKAMIEQLIERPD